MNLFLESVRSYTVTNTAATTIAQASPKWTQSGAIANTWVDGTFGRSGGPALVVSWGCLMTHSFGTAYTTLIAGTRWQATGTAFAGASATNSNLFLFRDGGTTLIAILVDDTGKIWVSNGASTAIADSGAWTTVRGVNHYYEVKIVFSATVGTVELRVDGVARINVTGKNTLGSGVSCTNVSTGQASTAGSPKYYYSDLYINDTTGTVNNDFEGDINVDYFPVNGAGASQQSTIGGTTPAATRWQGVDDAGSAGPDDGVTLNVLATGQKDTFTINASSLPASATVKSAQVIARAASDNAGINTDRVIARSGTTEAESADLSVVTTWQTLTYIAETDPATSAAWTVSGLQAMQVGLRKTA
jgi:hypothetical protein